jgi:hypothetical protein
MAAAGCLYVVSDLGIELSLRQTWLRYGRGTDGSSIALLIGMHWLF